MATYSNSAREVEMPNGDVVVLHSAPTGGANTTSNIKKFKYDDNGHVTESEAADAEDLNLSSYSTPTTGTTAIGTSDDIQTAIGKLDHQSQIDQSNILSLSDANGAKNLLNVEENSVTVSAAGFVVPETEIELEANKTYVISYSATATARSNFVAYSAIPTSASNKVVDVVIEAASSVVGQNSIEFTPSANVKVCKLYVQNFTGSVTFSNFMITTKSQFDISPTYEPYALGNQVLTPELIELCDSGAKNKATISSGSTTGTARWYEIPVTGLTVGETYVVYFGSITSTDTDNTRCQAIFMNGSTECSAWMHFYRGSNQYLSVKITSNPAILRVYAADSYAASENDTLTFSNLMVCTKAAFGVSHKYVPYRPNWDLVSNSVDYTTHMNVTGTSTVSNANLNNISVSEERVYNNPTNLPSGTSGYVICKTVVCDAQSAYQEIRFISSQINTTYGQSYPVFDRRKVSGTWRDWHILDIDGLYRLDNGSSNSTSKTISLTNIPDGYYLMCTRNSVSPTDRKGMSAYLLWIITSDYPSSMIKSIVETTNAKINTFSVISDGTATITYDATGYHTTSIRRL